MNFCIKMLVTASVAAAVMLLVSISASATEGDVFAAGTVYCARTYSGHANYFGGNDDSKAVDIGRVKEGLPLYAPESGTVQQVTWDNGQRTGWGHSIIWTSADGREKLHLAHLLDVVKTGPVQGGDLIGHVGSTGKSDGPHLHISRSLDGRPVNLVLSGQPIEPDYNYQACNSRYTSRGPISNGLIRAQGDIKVFWRQNGKRYHVLDPNILNAMSDMPGWSWNQIIELSWDEISRILEGPAFIAPDYRSEGILIRQNGTDPVYRVESGRLRHISYDECVQANCWPDIIDVTSAIMNLFQPPPDGMTVNLFAGWNMISTAGDWASWNQLKGDCVMTSGEWRGVWGFDARIQDWRVSSENDILDPMRGYWVMVEGSCQIRASGGASGYYLELRLYAGWNLISTVSRTTWNSIQKGCTMDSEWRGLWNYDPARQDWITLSENATLDPLKGYWVNVKSDCTIGAVASSSTAVLMSSQGNLNNLLTKSHKRLGIPPQPNFDAFRAQVKATKVIPRLQLNTKHKAIEFQITSPGFQAIELHIFNLNGALVKRVTSASGNTLHWGLIDNLERKAAPGVYIYVVTTEAQDGTRTRQLGKLLVRPKW